MARNNYELWRERYGLEQVRRLAEDGLSEEAIASALGLELTTMRLWLKKYPDFAAAIRLGSAESDYVVINALYKKATGHSVPLKKTYKLKHVEYDPDTGKKLREFEELATGIDETFVPADLNAEKFWLKSRQPERWGELLSEKDGAGDGESEGGVVEIPMADKLDDGADESDSDDKRKRSGGESLIGSRSAYRDSDGDSRSAYHTSEGE